MIVAFPHIPMHRIEKAVGRIRAMRKSTVPCEFPHDLGCETQLYLGAGMVMAFPRERMSIIAQACGVHVPDAPFFFTLLALAQDSPTQWMRREILQDVRRIFLGLPIDPLPRFTAPAHLAASGAPAPLDLLPGMRRT